MSGKIFRKGKNDIEVTTDTFKVFLRFNKPVTQSYVKSLIEELRMDTKIVLIPSLIDVIVVDKDGLVTKY